MNLNKLKKLIKESYLKEIGDLKNIDSYNFYKISPSR